MKNILFLLLAIVTNTLFAQKVAYNAEPGTVVVKGKIGNLNPPRQLWIYIGDDKWDTIAVNNGEFEYRKSTHLPAYGAIMVKYKPYYQGDRASGAFFGNMELKSLFFEAGTMIISSPVDSLKNKDAVYSGSAIQAKQDIYVTNLRRILSREKELAANFNQASPDQLQSDTYLAAYEQKTKGIHKSLDSLTATQINKEPGSLVSVMAFYEFLRTRKDHVSPERAKTLYGLFSEEFRSSDPGKTAYLAVEDLSKKTEPIPTIEIGMQAPAFSQNDLNGKPVELTDFKGKYVLIDFWASWCLPCRKVNPDLVKIHKEFGGSKFTILGVSLDEEKSKWQKAIVEDQLNWSHVSDLKGWKNAVARSYGIQGIPQNILIDPDGKVLNKNLKAGELKEVLTTVIKKEK